VDNRVEQPSWLSEGTAPKTNGSAAGEATEPAEQPAAKAGGDAPAPVGDDGKVTTPAEKPGDAPALANGLPADEGAPGKGPGDKRAQSGGPEREPAYSYEGGYVSGQDVFSPARPKKEPLSSGGFAEETATPLPEDPEPLGEVPEPVPLGEDPALAYGSGYPTPTGYADTAGGYADMAAAEPVAGQAGMPDAGYSMRAAYGVTDHAPGTGTSAYPPYAGDVQSKVAATEPRRANLIVARLEPWSVMKFSFLLSIVCWLILFVAVALLYYALSGLGVFAALQKTLQSVTSSQTSTGVNITKWTSAPRVLGYTMLIGAVNVVLITALSTVGAVIYNLVTHLGGGIEVTLRESSD
jgi:Transmembrane domain of unknown function (DUF3566)